MTAPLPDLLSWSGPGVVGEANFGYYLQDIGMNKSKRVASIKHRRKEKKLEAKRKAQGTPAEK